jgi:hypothetical protein
MPSRCGGGGGGNSGGGGGGAGGVILRTGIEDQLGICRNRGSGGAAYSNGGNSIFSSITAIGGGRGGTYPGLDIANQEPLVALVVVVH